MPIGFTSGQIPSVPMNLPLLKNYSIVGVFTGAWAEKFPEQAVRMNDTLAQMLAEGKIRPHIDRVLPLEQVKEAMRALASRTVQGRIVLKIKVERVGGAKRSEARGESIDDIDHHRQALPRSSELRERRICLRPAGPAHSRRRGGDAARAASPGQAARCRRDGRRVMGASRWRHSRRYRTIGKCGTFAPGKGKFRRGTRSRTADAD